MSCSSSLPTYQPTSPANHNTCLPTTYLTPNPAIGFKKKPATPTDRPIACCSSRIAIRTMPGFDFSNYNRNAALHARGVPLPKATSTGTTIVGCIFDGGVVVSSVLLSPPHPGQTHTHRVQRPLCVDVYGCESVWSSTD